LLKAGLSTAQVKSLRPQCAQIIVLCFLAVAVSVFAQRNSSPGTPDQARSPAYGSLTAVGVQKDKIGPAVEIILTRPVTPAIQRLEGPPRLVIDLPKTRMAVKTKRLSVQQHQIADIRVDLFQSDPPVTRVVVDLLSPSSYSWEAAGNRLLVHLQPAAENTARSPSNVAEVKPPSVIAFSKGVQLAVVPVSPGSNGAVVEAGSRVAAGSAVTAAQDTAVLRLARGGEIRVCPGTTVSITSSKSGGDVMLGMSTGAIETHYKLAGSTDSILTPDFRILLPGPGEFDYAVSVDNRGDTCVRALIGNTAAAVVSESMGDRTYHVKATDQLMFHLGRLDQVDANVPMECGCPAPRPPVMRASGQELPVIPESQAPANLRLAQADDPPRPTPTLSTLSAPSSATPSSAPVNLSVIPPQTIPWTTPSASAIHIAADAPLVYRGTDLQPAPTLEAARLPLVSPARQPKLQTVALAPPPHAFQAEQNGSAKPPQRGFFGKVKGFFASVFH
jgi:hypothetical protein